MSSAFDTQVMIGKRTTTENPYSMSFDPSGVKFQSEKSLGDIYKEAIKGSTVQSRYTDGAEINYETLREIYAEDPIIFQKVYEAVITNYASPLSKYFPRKVIDTIEWMYEKTIFDIEMAEPSVLNTAPRVASFREEYVQGHLVFRQQAVEFSRDSLVDPEGEAILKWRVSRLLSNLEVTLAQRLAYAMANSSDEWANAGKRAALNGLVSRDVQDALSKRAANYCLVTKERGSLRKLINTATAVMTQIGDFNRPTAIFTTEDTKRMLSFMDRSRVTYLTEGPDALNNRENVIESINVNGNSIQLLSAPKIDDRSGSLNDNRPLLYTSTNGAFAEFVNVSKGMHPEEYKTHLSSLEMTDWVTNGFKTWTLYDALKVCPWFVGMAEDFPAHDIFRGDDVKSDLREGGLNYRRLSALAKTLEESGKNDSRIIDHNTRTDYSQVPWMADVFLRYNKDWKSKKQMIDKTEGGATTKVMDKQDAYIPVYYTGEIDPKFLPNSHILFMAQCILENAPDLIKDYKPDDDKAIFEKSLEKDGDLVKFKYSEVREAATKGKAYGKVHKDIVEKRAGLFKSRAEFHKTLPGKTASAFLFVCFMPITLQNFKVLASNNVPLPVLAKLVADSQAQKVEMAMVLSTSPGYHLMHRGGLYNVMLTNVIGGTTTREAAMHENIAILNPQAIYSIEDMVGRYTIGGCGNGYINQTENGKFVSCEDIASWNRIVMPRVGNGRKQGPNSWMVVPIPIEDHTESFAYQSSTGYFKPACFDRYLAEDADPGQFDYSTVPHFVGVSFLNSVFHIYKKHPFNAAVPEKASFVERNNILVNNNIIAVVSCKTYSSLAKKFVSCKSFHNWGALGQGVRDMITSEIPYNTGLTEDSQYRPDNYEEDFPY